MAGDIWNIRIVLHAHPDSAGGFGISGEGGDLAVGCDFSAGNAFGNLVDGIAEGFTHTTQCHPDRERTTSGRISTIELRSKNHELRKILVFILFVHLLDS